MSLPLLGKTLFMLLLAWAPAAWAADAPKINAANTAWMITASTLVLFMTLPGLALFYAGLVRAKNVLSVLMHCMALTAVGTLLWLAVGYSLAFDTTGMIAGSGNLHAFIGTLEKAFLRGLTVDSAWGSIPEVPANPAQFAPCIQLIRIRP